MIVTEKLKIKNLHKYGFFTDKDESVNWGPRFTDKVNLVPGVEAEFVLFVANSGKKYVNELKGLSKAEFKASPKEEIKPEAKSEAKTEVKGEFKKPKAQADTSMTKSEWQAKDRSQLIGGLSHDAAAIAAAWVNVQGSSNEEALANYKFFLEGMLKIREELK